MLEPNTQDKSHMRPPNKRGLSRLLFLLTHKAGDLLKLNLLLQLSLLPSQALLAWLVTHPAPSGTGWLIVALLGIIAALPVGPSLAAASRCIGMALMERHCYIWPEYSRAWRNSCRQTLLAGVLCGVAASLYSFFFFLVMAGTVQSSPLLLLGIGLSMLVFCMVAPVCFLQAAFMDLPPAVLVKNSVLLAGGYLPGFLLSALPYMAVLFLELAFFPSLLVLLPLLGYAPPMLIGHFCIWAKLDALFSISSSLKH